MERRYRCIVADPPWQPALGAGWGARVDKGRPQRFYRTMSLDAIKALPVPAATQCHLYLWAVSQHVDWAYDVARAWGFDPVILVTWKKPGLGVGRFRANTEHFLIARKGSRHGQPFGLGGRHEQAMMGTLVDWPRGRHSEKPEAIFDLAERLSPGPRLELFARANRPGWDGWGDECPHSVSLPSSEASEAASNALVTRAISRFRDGVRKAQWLRARADEQEPQR